MILFKYTILDYSEVLSFMNNYGKIDIILNEVMKSKSFTISRLCREAKLQFKQAQGYMGNTIESVDLNVLARICNAVDCEISDVLKYTKK